MRYSSDEVVAKLRSAYLARAIWAPKHHGWNFKANIINSKHDDQHDCFRMWSRASAMVRQVQEEEQLGIWTYHDEWLARPSLQSQSSERGPDQRETVWADPCFAVIHELFLETAFQFWLMFGLASVWRILYERSESFFVYDLKLDWIQQWLEWSNKTCNQCSRRVMTDRLEQERCKKGYVCCGLVWWQSLRCMDVAWFESTRMAAYVLKFRL